MTDDFRSAYLRDILRTYRNYKTLGERAIAQVSDPDLHVLVDPDSNSIAIIVKHLAGNLRSRFTDFLTTDGEKPDRNRDQEFEMPDLVSRAAIMGWWESSWQIALKSIEGLSGNDLQKIVTIRGEALTAIEALNRLNDHAAYHVGELIFFRRVTGAWGE